MKGKLINKDQKWIVQYEEVDNTSFGIAAATGGTIIPSVKELPLHPIYITLNNSIKSKFSLEEGKEVEFEIVEELEDWGAIKATLQKVQYAKLIQPKEEVSEEAKQRTKNLYTPSHKKYIEKEETKITRVEVIDEKGRSYTNYNVKELELSYQDEGRTLKLFIK